MTTVQSELCVGNNPLICYSNLRADSKKKNQSHGCKWHSRVSVFHVPSKHLIFLDCYTGTASCFQVTEHHSWKVMNFKTFTVS